MLYRRFWSICAYSMDSLGLEVEMFPYINAEFRYVLYPGSNYFKSKLISVKPSLFLPDVELQSPNSSFTHLVTSWMTSDFPSPLWNPSSFAFSSSSFQMSFTSHCYSTISVD